MIQKDTAKKKSTGYEGRRRKQDESLIIPTLNQARSDTHRPYQGLCSAHERLKKPLVKVPEVTALPVVNEDEGQLHDKGIQRWKAC